MLISAALTTVDIFFNVAVMQKLRTVPFFCAQKPLMKHSETEAEEVQFILIMCTDY